MHEYRDIDQVICFIKGLRDQYSVVRSQIMPMEPLPNIDKVYSLLVQQATLPLDESKILFAAQYSQSYGRGSSSCGRGYMGGRTSYDRGRGRRICTHCGEIGHTIDTCFKKYKKKPSKSCKH